MYVEKKKTSAWVYFLVIIIFLALGAASGYAYYKGLWSFQNNKQETSTEESFSENTDEIVVNEGFLSEENDLNTQGSALSQPTLSFGEKDCGTIPPDATIMQATAKKEGKTPDRTASDCIGAALATCSLATAAVVESYDPESDDLYLKSNTGSTMRGMYITVKGASGDNCVIESVDFTQFDKVTNIPRRMKQKIELALPVLECNLPKEYLTHAHSWSEEMIAALPSMMPSVYTRVYQFAYAIPVQMRSILSPKSPAAVSGEYATGTKEIFEMKDPVTEEKVAFSCTVTGKQIVEYVPK